MSDNLPNNRDKEVSEIGRTSFLKRGAILSILLTLGALATVKTGCGEEKKPAIDLDDIMFRINRGQMSPDGGTREDGLAPGKQSKPENKKIKQKAVKPKDESVEEGGVEDSEDDEDSSGNEGSVMV